MKYIYCLVLSIFFVSLGFSDQLRCDVIKTATLGPNVIVSNLQISRSGKYVYAFYTQRENNAYTWSESSRYEGRLFLSNDYGINWKNVNFLDHSFFRDCPSIGCIKPVISFSGKYA